MTRNRGNEPRSGILGLGFPEPQGEAPRSALAAELASPDPAVRWRTAAVLADLPGEESEALLLQLLGDVDYRVRERSLAALARRFTPGVASACAVALADDENAGRRGAALVLLSHAGAEGRRVLLGALQHPSPDVRISAAMALPGPRADAPTVAALEAAARHEGDPNARAALLLALGRTGRREAIPSLLAVLDEGSLWLRVHALEALGEMGDPDVASRILPLLDHPPLRRAALKALSCLESAAPVEELTRRAAAGEADEALLAALRRSAAADRALFLRRAGELWPRAGESLAAVVASPDSSDAERTDAAHLLALLDAPGAASALVQHGPFADAFEVLRALPLERFSEALSAALQAEDPEPALALVTLARSRGQESALSPLLVHPSPVVRASTLGSLPPGSVPVGELIDILAEEDPETALAAALCLAAPTPDAPDAERVRRSALVDRAGGPDGPGRAAAVQALAQVDFPEAADAIRLALNSADPEVRRAAALSAAQRPDLGSGDFVPRLVDPDFGVRAALLRALARRAENGLPAPLTWRELLPSLADEPAVAAAAGAAIVALAGDERPRVVDEMLAQSDPVRRAALEELLTLKDPHASARAAIAIHHEDVETARAAVEAQAWTPARAAETTLAHALSDSRAEVRQTAAEVISRRPAHPPGDGPLSPALAEALHSEREPEALTALLAAVAVAGGQECLEPLTLVLAAEASPAADGAAEALARRYPSEVRNLWADAPARAERRWARAIARAAARRLGQGAA